MMDPASIPIPFPLWQSLWWVGSGYREEWVTCPECVGTKTLRFIKGTGEEVTLDCATCSAGYEPPRGVVRRYVYEHRPVPFTPQRVRVDGEEYTYSEATPDARAYGSVSAKDLFSTEAACAARCVELNAEHTAHEAEQAIQNIASKRREMAWSVTYWSRKVKDLERDLERARDRLDASRARKQQVT